MILLFRRLISCVLFIFVILTTCFKTNAQLKGKGIFEESDIIPIVGKLIPDFKLNNVFNYPTDKFVFPEFKEKKKWLILDFFTSTCLSCFASFPKIDKLQRAFKDSIQFILVGDNEHKYGKHIKEIFERVSERQNLNLTVAYDSLLFNKWGINSVPFIIIIDDLGVVRAINNGQDMNAENLDKLLNNRQAETFFRDINYENWDINYPFLTNGNGGPDTAFLFRSLLSEWKRPTAFFPPSSISKYNEEITPAKGIQASGVTLDWLFKIAYLDKTIIPFGDSLYGKVWPFVLFEGIDSARFVVNDNIEKNIFNYSLIVPKEKANTNFVMQVMQSDLKNYFEMEAKVETRKMPYWRLVASKKTKMKLRTKGNKYYNDRLGASGIEFRDYPINKMLRTIWAYHQLQPPFIDETGIKYNIDISLDALLTNFENIKTALRKNELDLVLDKKDMKVLVVTTSPKTSLP